MQTQPTKNFAARAARQSLGRLATETADPTPASLADFNARLRAAVIGDVTPESLADANKRVKPAVRRLVGHGQQLAAERDEVLSSANEALLALSVVGVDPHRPATKHKFSRAFSRANARRVEAQQERHDREQAFKIARTEMLKRKRARVEAKKVADKARMDALAATLKAQMTARKPSRVDRKAIA